MPYALKYVNTWQVQNRPFYYAKQSAIKVLGTAQKKDLTASPYTNFFEYG